MNRCYQLVLLLPVSCLLASCNNTPDDETKDDKPVAVTGTIDLLIVGDSEIGELIQRQWQARTESKLRFTDVDRRTFENQTKELVEKHDVIIYPADMLADMAARQHLLPISDSTQNLKQFDKRGIFTLERTAVVSWGKKVWGVSLGAPRPVLIYNESQLKQLKIPVPQTRRQFDDVVERLQAVKAVEPNEVLEPTMGHWASFSLFTRVADYVVVPGRYSILFEFESANAQINTPPFVRALEEMKATWKTRKSGNDHLNPAQVVQKLAEGKAAIGISWPHAAGLQPNIENAVFDELRVSEFPVAKQTFDAFSQRWDHRPNDLQRNVPVVGHTGLLVSHSAYTKKTGLANHFLVWLASKKIIQEISPYSAQGNMTRPNQAALTQLWIGRSWPAEVQDEYGQIVSAVNEPGGMARCVENTRARSVPGYSG